MVGCAAQKSPEQMKEERDAAAKLANAAKQVKVLSAGEVSSCKLVRGAEAASRGTSLNPGSYDSALNALKTAAARDGANAAVIDDVRTILNQPPYGHVIIGRLYSCP